MFISGINMKKKWNKYVLGYRTDDDIHDMRYLNNKNVFKKESECETYKKDIKNERDRKILRESMGEIETSTVCE